MVNHLLMKLNVFVVSPFDAGAWTPTNSSLLVSCVPLGDNVCGFEGLILVNDPLLPSDYCAVFADYYGVPANHFAGCTSYAHVTAYQCLCLRLLPHRLRVITELSTSTMSTVSYYINPAQVRPIMTTTHELTRHSPMSASTPTTATSVRPWLSASTPTTSSATSVLPWLQVLRVCALRPQLCLR